MTYRFFKYAFIHMLLFLFLFGRAGVSYAILSMDEVRRLFAEETGAQWESVTAGERRDFLRKIRKTSTVAGRTGFWEERKPEGKTPFDIRMSFEKETGIEWEDAAEKEQEEFQKKYKRLEKERKRKERERLKAEQRREKERARAKRLEEQRIERAKREKERKERMKHKELEEKRKEEARKMREAKRKLDELRRKSRSRR